MTTLRATGIFLTVIAVAACSGNSPATVVPTTTPQPTATHAPTATQAPTATPAPTNTPAPTATAKSTSATSPLDGAYLTVSTKNDLASSPLLLDRSEVNDENWGTWTLTFKAGNVEYAQGNDLASSNSSGTFVVYGDVVTMRFVGGANTGETFVFRWTLNGTSLTFRRDTTLGLGPTPFLVTPWTKTGGPVAIPLGGYGATLFPSTYLTKFDPALALTVGDAVDIDCFPGYMCRGDVDVNVPSWLDLEFGNVHGSELMIFGLDKLSDPKSPGKFIDLPSAPAEFGPWISSQPAVKVLQPAHDVVVGGTPGVELDIETGDLGLSFGLTGMTDPATLGMCTCKARVTGLRVGDREVVILRMLGPENTTGNFGAAASGLQKIVDSIFFVRS